MNKLETKLLRGTSQ